MKNSKNFRKNAAAVVSAILVVALLVGGTFAYFAGQSRLNEFTEARTFSGGVGRDDYDPAEGTGNKDVYVENKSDDSYLFARIKLEEFFEVLHKNASKAEVLVGKDGANKDSYEGWINHLVAPTGDGTGRTVNCTGKECEEAHKVFEWLMGGKKIYKPAPESAIAADGTTNGTAYNDTKVYESLTDESGLAETPMGKVITYDYWKNTLNEEAGDYWVLCYDADTDDYWFHWANPIAPGAATGLLLDQVNVDKTKLPADWKEYFYGINVIFEFADEDPDDFKKLYDESGEQGQSVLDAAKKAVPAAPAEFKIIGDATVVPGKSVTYEATIDGEPAQGVSWSLKDDTYASIKSSTGVLTVDGNAPAGTKLVIIAKVGDETTEYEVTVDNAPVEDVYTITGDNEVTKGESATYEAKKNGEKDESVSWSIKETNKAAGTTITDGVLTIDKNEALSQITVVADFGNGKTQEYVVTLNNAPVDDTVLPLFETETSRTITVGVWRTTTNEIEFYEIGGSRTYDLSTALGENASKATNVNIVSMKATLYGEETEIDVADCLYEGAENGLSYDPSTTTLTTAILFNYETWQKVCLGKPYLHYDSVAFDVTVNFTQGSGENMKTSEDFVIHVVFDGTI